MVSIYKCDLNGRTEFENIAPNCSNSFFASITSFNNRKFIIKIDCRQNRFNEKIVNLIKSFKSLEPFFEIEEYDTNKYSLTFIHDKTFNLEQNKYLLKWVYSLLRISSVCNQETHLEFFDYLINRKIDECKKLIYFLLSIKFFSTYNAVSHFNFPVVEFYITPKANKYLYTQIKYKDNEFRHKTILDYIFKEKSVHYQLNFYTTNQSFYNKSMSILRPLVNKKDFKSVVSELKNLLETDMLILNQAETVEGQQMKQIIINKTSRSGSNIYMENDIKMFKSVRKYYIDSIIKNKEHINYAVLKQELKNRFLLTDIEYKKVLNNFESNGRSNKVQQ
jgi:hypothetical protein